LAEPVEIPPVNAVVVEEKSSVATTNSRGDSTRIQTAHYGHVAIGRGEDKTMKAPAWQHECGQDVVDMYGVSIGEEVQAVLLPRYVGLVERKKMTAVFGSRVCTYLSAYTASAYTWRGVYATK
jgi:hypothetical protein